MAMSRQKEARFNVVFHKIIHCMLFEAENWAIGAPAARKILQFRWTSYNTIHPFNAVLIVGQRRRRWATIEPTLSECLVFADNL